MDKCPDCHGELEKGVLLDQTYGGVTAQRYAKADMPDAPDARFKIVFESKFTDLRRVTARRCISCNRIFLYAQSTVTVQSLNKNVFKRLVIIFTILLAIALVVIFITS